MDSEDKRKLDRVLKLAEENNEYVREVRSSQKTSQMWKSIYWVLVIAAVLGGYYYLKPYLAKMTQIYSAISGEKAGLGFSIPGTKNLEGLLDGIMSPQVKE